MPFQGNQLRIPGADQHRGRGKAMQTIAGDRVDRFQNRAHLIRDVLIEDAGTFDEVFMTENIDSESAFNACLEKGKAELHEKMLQWCQLLTGILDGYRAIKKLMKKPALTQLDTVSDIQAQLNALFPDNFITVIEHDWLKQYPRYLAGISKRFEKSKSNATRDRQLRLEFNKLWDEYEQRQAALEKQHIDSAQLRHYRWMLEEYRVSLFAQELRTRFPVSEKRLKKYWADMSDA